MERKIAARQERDGKPGQARQTRNSGGYPIRMHDALAPDAARQRVVAIIIRPGRRHAGTDGSDDQTRHVRVMVMGIQEHRRRGLRAGEQQDHQDQQPCDHPLPSVHRASRHGLSLPHATDRLDQFLDLVSLFDRIA
jgi:hypothetical protein